MKLDRNLLDSVSTEAKDSQRLRKAFDMRTTTVDNSQRMLNAIEPGTDLPIHRHRNSSESCIVIRGCAEEIFYDNEGNITESVKMQPDSDCIGVNIEKGRWHKIVPHELGAVIFEAKDGAYESVSPEDILDI